MFEIDVSTNAVKAATGLAAKLSDLKPPLAETGAYLERAAKLRFVTQTDPDGQKWAALKPSTIARKKTGFTYRKGRRTRVKFSESILRETGSLAASIAFNVSGNQVRVKPSVDYGIYHQTGTRRMKQRAFMGFEKDDPARIAQIFADHIEGR